MYYTTTRTCTHTHTHTHARTHSEEEGLYTHRYIYTERENASGGDGGGRNASAARHCRSSARKACQWLHDSVGISKIICIDGSVNGESGIASGRCECAGDVDAARDVFVVVVERKWRHARASECVSRSSAADEDERRAGQAA